MQAESNIRLTSAEFQKSRRVLFSNRLHSPTSLVHSPGTSKQKQTQISFFVPNLTKRASDIHFNYKWTDTFFKEKT